MLEKVVCGFQTGADQGAARAARRFGLPTGGLMPRGWLTEDGPRPEFAALYGAAEHESLAYPPRTRANVRAADVLIVFDTSYGRALVDMSRGTQCAINEAIKCGIPSVTAAVRIGEPIVLKRPAALADRLLELRAKVLFVGGNRESKVPGIGAWVEEYLCEVFKQLGFTEAGNGGGG